MKGVPILPPRLWTAEEQARLVELYPLHSNPEIGHLLNRTESAVLGRAAKLGLVKPDGFKNTGRYNAGNVPFNKGKPFPSTGRSAETQFKPGKKPGNYKPVGSERLSKDGYLQRKMTDTGYPPRDWVAVHHVIWREAGREIPPKHIVVFKDGDKTNIVLDNLELISMAENMKRNTYHQYGPEISAVVQLRGAITRQINKRSKSA